MTSDVLVDTGPIVAILSQSDEFHQQCVDQLHRISGRLFTCWPVITEAAWLLRAYPGSIRRFLGSFNGEPFDLLPLDEADLPSIDAILERYQSLRLQLADAALLHLANRAAIQTIFTLDRGDFSVLRLPHGKRLRLIP